MSANALDRRVADLEREVATLKKSLHEEESAKDWRRTVGMFKGDAVMVGIDKLTLQVREEDRKKARQRKPMRKVATS